MGNELLLTSLATVHVYNYYCLFLSYLFLRFFFTGHTLKPSNSSVTLQGDYTFLHHFQTHLQSNTLLLCVVLLTSKLTLGLLCIYYTVLLFVEIKELDAQVLRLSVHAMQQQPI